MFAIPFLLLLASCDSDPTPANGEYIFRQSRDKQFVIAEAKPLEVAAYPWEEGKVGKLPKITKEFFRCKGSQLNPPRSEMVNGENVTFYDCGGSDKHSLPLFDGKENVYPILIDLLNHIQTVTKKKAIITSGHRCPDHNTYLDASIAHQMSKHTIGAEVSFYVLGFEDKPEAIIKIIQDFYLKDPVTKNDKRYTEFKRYDKGDTDVSTPPWMNHEIFIKLYRKKEGRNHDNRHPYPYLAIQVRFDRKKNERVTYSWDKAYNNFLRY